MRLPFAAAGMAAAGVGSAMVAGFGAAGYVFPWLPLVGWVLFGASIVAPVLLFIVESRIHPQQWLQWQVYMRDKTAWDMFRGRHIPTFHDPSHPGTAR
jgi:hypothetical protein